VSDAAGASAVAVSGAAPRPRHGYAVPLALFAALALAPVAAKLGPEGYILSLLTRVMILAIAAVSLDLILGYGGLISFGHAAYVGIGAYAVAIPMSHGHPELALHLAAARSWPSSPARSRCAPRASTSS
jgi:branched-chain amino acid transport system permease protein